MFRFTIRDVLWLTAVVAVLCGCFVNSLELVHAMVSQCDRAWSQLSASDPLVAGRDTVPLDW